MTLYGLDKRGLVNLPLLWVKDGTDCSYYKGPIDGLRLCYIKNWGKDGRDDAITLYGEDIATETRYSADIRNIAEVLDKNFIVQCLIDSYGQTVREVFSSHLQLDRDSKQRISTLALLRSRLVDYFEV